MEINQATLPRVLVNRRYYQELRHGPQDKGSKAWLADCLASANWLMKALDQRQRTIERITREIIKAQKEFFEHGVSQLKPLTMTQIAEVVGVHETTVSRAVSGKYMDTPHGVFEMKHFFTSGFTAADGQAVSPLHFFEQLQSFEAQWAADRLCRLLHVNNFVHQAGDIGWLFLNIHPAVFVHGAMQTQALDASVRTVQSLGLPMHRVVLEVTEDVMAQEADFERAVANVRQTGCLLALDDFGAGHSNFDRIWHIHPEIVKLDRSLLRRACGSPRIARVLAQHGGAGVRHRSTLRPPNRSGSWSWLVPTRLRSRSPPAPGWRQASARVGGLFVISFLSGTIPARRRVEPPRSDSEFDERGQDAGSARLPALPCRRVRGGDRERALARAALWRVARSPRRRSVAQDQEG